MKKLLMTMIATTVIATTAAKAESSSEQSFYIRGDFGGYWNQKQSIGPKGERIGLGPGSVAPALNVGVGYNILPQFRIEGVYTHIFNSEVNGCRSQGGIGINLKAKGSIQAFMFNGVYDVYKLDAGAIFIGAGIGVARVGDKMYVKETYIEKGGKLHIDEFTEKLKKKNNFAYNLMVGGNYKISEQANLDLQYIWADYGNAKSDDSKIRHRGHGVKMGIRYSL